MSAHFGPPPPFNLALSDPEAGRIPAKADVYGDVSSSDASVQTVHGTARVRWEREGTTLALTIVIPSGARARVEIGNSVDIVPTGTHQLTYELERNTQ